MNADIAEAVRNGGNAWRHFIHYGEREGRVQISGAFMAERARLGRAKFERFRHTLALADGEQFRFFDGADSCPIVTSDRHFDRSDYAIESSNSNYPPFGDQIIGHPDRLYLDIGCGLRDEVFDNCLYVEVYPSLTADVIVAPDCRYPFASDMFDGIGCFAVLEHVTKPWQVAAEIRRMLKPGGKCYICWPFLQPVHGYPSHYYNATRQGLELMFSDGFELDFCRTEPWEAPNYTINWILDKFVGALPAAKKKTVMAMTVADLIAQPRSGPFWTSMLKDLPDALISEFACGNSLVATKR